MISKFLQLPDKIPSQIQNRKYISLFVVIILQQDGLIKRSSVGLLDLFKKLWSVIDWVALHIGLFIPPPALITSFVSDLMYANNEAVLVLSLSSPLVPLYITVISV